jgi:hypothetical protein
MGAQLEFLPKLSLRQRHLKNSLFEECSREKVCGTKANKIQKEGKSRLGCLIGWELELGGKCFQMLLGRRMGHIQK